MKQGFNGDNYVDIYYIWYHDKKPGQYAKDEMHH